MFRRMIAAVAAFLMLGCMFTSAENILENRISVLEGLGIEFPDEAVDDFNVSIEKFFDYMPEEFGYTEEDFFGYPELLRALGRGKRDPETWSFVPYCDDLYAFDAEMMDMEKDYIDLLEAVEMISGGEVQMENCTAEVTDEVFMEGTGEQAVIFTMNGIPCEYTAQVMYDWMDCDIIGYINQQLDKTELEKRLWCMFDGGQGFICFFTDEEWVGEFQKATGYGLYLNADAANEHFIWE